MACCVKDYTLQADSGARMQPHSQGLNTAQATKGCEYILLLYNEFWGKCISSCGFLWLPFFIVPKTEKKWWSINSVQSMYHFHLYFP